VSLEDRIKALIEQSGPMSQPDYMTLCLHDRRSGYYATRPALGQQGDFITAPLVSQMFGELIGLWALETWRGLGAPPNVALVELGPGDGTLMSDMIRVTQRHGWPDRVILVEPSAAMGATQRERLGDRARWVETVDELPRDRPLIVVANEVLDCLPARAFVRTEAGWAERRVGLDAGGHLIFVLTPSALPPSDAPLGAVLERADAQAALAADLATRIAEQGGAALLIDYGRAEPGYGDTLQAVAAHRKVDPLAEPGQADLTVWVDFPAVAQAAQAAAAEVSAVVPQGEFLRRLGIEARAAVLSRARPEHAPTIARQLHRLTAPDQMGELFKAIAIHRPGDPVPPGFETPA
jgi:SAM-dependent MidA family methyltransferase